MTETNTKKEFLEALIKAQQEIVGVYKAKINPHFKNKYVPLNNILAEIKPVLNDNGFFLTQKILIQEGQEVLKTEILHINGEVLESTAPLNIAEKNNPQKYGSAMTYMRRYSLNALLGLEEEDDDGKKASEAKKVVATINAQQLEELQTALEGTGKTAKDICDAYKINSLSELRGDQFGSVVKKLKELTNGDN